MVGRLSAARLWYARCLETRPITTNALTSGTVMLLGDVAAQKLEGSDSIEWKRTAVLASFNGGFGAPFFTLFWRALEARVPGQHLRAAVAKAVLTAVLANPVMNGAFFTYSTALEHAIFPQKPGGPGLLEAVETKLREKYLRTIATSASVWIPVNTANFALVAPQYRVLVSQGCAVVWSAYLSLVQHEAAKADAIQH